MKLNLYEHNQIAYEKVKKLLESDRKATVIHPTGTGKSYIAFQLVLDHPDKSFLWISPSEYIFKSQCRALAQNDGLKAIIDRIEFHTYAWLSVNEDKFSELSPDYIILDEFHRAGAHNWEHSVKKLMMCCCASRLLGLSATSIRYLDNQRDMAKALFENSVASQMNLCEAMARGILPAPKYVVGSYGQGGLEAELRRNLNDISKLNMEVSRLNMEVSGIDDELKRKFINTLNHQFTNTVNDSFSEQYNSISDNKVLKSSKIVEKLKKSLEDIEGFDTIFKRHMPDRYGKYIVFCSNISHMYEMIAKVPEWFVDVDARPHVYHMYSENPRSEKELEAFTTDNSMHLKLLFVIDMLNEGIHIPDIDGAILLRPTVSPILYRQQIGRVLSAGNRRRPVIFDLVNNVYGLYKIEAVREELEQCYNDIQQQAGYDREENSSLIRLHGFQIIDELADFHQLIDELNQHQETLAEPQESQQQISAFDKRFQEGLAAFVAYKEKHQETPLVKITYVNPNGIKLGAWAKKMRELKANDQLDDIYIKQLEAVGFVWNHDDYLWMQHYNDLVEYMNEHDCSITDIRANNQNLLINREATWLREQRRQYYLPEHGRLSEKQIVLLEEIGYTWTNEPKRSWYTGYEELLRYKQKYGNVAVPVKYKTEDGFNLGKWVSHAKYDYKSGRMSEERRNLMGWLL